MSNILGGSEKIDKLNHRKNGFANNARKTSYLKDFKSSKAINGTHTKHHFHRKFTKRKVKKVRLNSNLKNKSHKRYSRDYPFSYENAQWKSFSSKVAFPANVLAPKTVIPQSGSSNNALYNKLPLFQYNQYKDPNYLNRRYNIYNPYQYSYYKQSFTPKSFLTSPVRQQYQNSIDSSKRNKDIEKTVSNTLRSSIERKNTKTLNIKYQPKYDIMAVDDKQSSLLQKSEIAKKNESSINILTTVKDTSVSNSNIEGHVRNVVQPLSEVPTDVETHSITEKDSIPKPEEFTADNMVETSDSSIDVPFSSSAKLPPPSSYLAGNTTSELLQQDAATSNLLESEQNDSLSQITYTSASPSKPASVTSYIYSMLYPISTIQRESYQKQFLQRKPHQPLKNKLLMRIVVVVALV